MLVLKYVEYGSNFEYFLFQAMGMQHFGLHEAQMAQHNLEAKAHFAHYGLQWQEAMSSSVIDFWFPHFPPRSAANLGQ